MKDDIQKRIYELNSDEEIRRFVEERIEQLEENSIETTVGQNYTDSFREYISQKTHYKAAEKLGEEECPDLVYDDITPYIELVQSVREANWYSEMTLFSTIFFVIYNYFPSDDIGLGRYMTYASHKGKRLSIKTVKDNECALCSEKAGMAHNMFKFLGIDSEVVCGARNNRMHAYNFVFPNGYENEPMVLYDPSHFINFTNKDRKLSFGFYKAFRKEEYESLKEGTAMKIDLRKTEQNYRNLYGENGTLDDYIFEDKSPTYLYGLENAKKSRNSR